jgi:hypothetical protein
LTLKILDAVQTKLFRAARQDDRRISDFPVSLLGSPPLPMEQRWVFIAVRADQLFSSIVRQHQRCLMLPSITVVLMS